MRNPELARWSLSDPSLKILREEERGGSPGAAADLADLEPLVRFYRAVAESDAVSPPAKLVAAGLNAPCALYVDTLDDGGTATWNLITEHKAVIEHLAKETKSSLSLDEVREGSHWSTSR